MSYGHSGSGQAPWLATDLMPSRIIAPLSDLTRAGGVVCLLSFLAQPATVQAGRWLAKELTVVAANAYTHDEFDRTMSLVADGRVKLQPLT